MPFGPVRALCHNERREKSPLAGEVARPFFVELYLLSGADSGFPRFWGPRPNGRFVPEITVRSLPMRYLRSAIVATKVAGNPPNCGRTAPPHLVVTSSYRCYPAWRSQRSRYWR